MKVKSEVMSAKLNLSSNPFRNRVPAVDSDRFGRILIGSRAVIHRAVDISDKRQNPDDRTGHRRSEKAKLTR